MVTGCPLVDGLLVVGEMDLRGRLKQVAGLGAMARAASDMRLVRMVIPSDGHEEALGDAAKDGEALPSLLQDCDQAADMLEVLEHAVPGELRRR